jgi:hypothetical protein
VRSSRSCSQTTQPLSASVKATLADIKAGSFVGIGAMPQADGTQRALEVLMPNVVAKFKRRGIRETSFAALRRRRSHARAALRRKGG